MSNGDDGNVNDGNDGDGVYRLRPVPTDADGQSENPEMVDASDPGVHRKRLTKAALHHRDVQRFWQGVFANPVGRAEMWAILQQAGTFDDRFGVGPNGFPQPEASWFHMGARSFGLRLFQSWQALAREGVILMQTRTIRARAQKCRLDERR
jgi:hypothetical protein